MSVLATLRPPRTEDVMAVVDIHHRRAEADGFDPMSTLEHMPTLDEVAAMFGDASDSCIATVADSVVGYATISFWIEEDDTCVYLQRVVADANVHTTDIVSSLFDWSEQRATELNRPRRGGKSVLAANATSTEHDRVELLRARRYSQVFSMVEMEHRGPMDLNPIKPAGVVVRS